jgi:hypothetical protein
VHAGERVCGVTGATRACVERCSSTPDACTASHSLLQHSLTLTQMDEILSSTADKMKNFAVIFLVDISEVGVRLWDTVGHSSLCQAQAWLPAHTHTRARATGARLLHDV